MPKYLQKISDQLTRYGYTVGAGSSGFPAALQDFLVPLAKRLEWFGYQVT